jgi:hypothetical protein
MTPAVPRISALLAAILALAACGTTASPSTSVDASASKGPVSQAPELVAVVCQSAAKRFDPTDVDLTGAWSANDDGIYYLRQLGSVLWWNGMSDRSGSPLDLGRVWNNVARGEINGLQIDVEWADVPRSQDTGHGTLSLSIQDDGTGNVQIVKVSETGTGFGGEVWTPCTPIEGQVADYVRTYGGDAFRYATILTIEGCDSLAVLKTSVTTTLNTAEAGSPEFQTALGYSNAISARQLALDC